MNLKLAYNFFPAMILMSLLSGCTDYSLTTKIARATLFDVGGAPNEVAFRGALSEKFPIGSPIKALIDYSGEIHGYCTYGAHHVLEYCQVPFGRDECSVRILFLKVTAESERISSLDVKIGDPMICD